MSMIIPAGVNKLDWSPKGKVATTVKTAGADENSTQEVTEEVDALAEAAKAFLSNKEAADCVAKECGCEGGATCEACGALLAEDEIVEEAPIGEEEAAEVVEVSDEAPVEDAEVSEETAIESIEIAIETAEEAVEEVKEAVEELKGTEVAEEGLVDDVGDTTEITEVEIEVPGVMEDEVADDEVEKEGMFTTMSDESTEELTVAESSEEFCKFAKLSPQNRSKIAEYWVNMLGYPKDYVSLLTKDYEK